MSQSHCTHGRNERPSFTSTMQVGRHPMSDSQLKQLDLNLLGTFDALLREQSVTRAAEALGVTQSAVSHALNRLRAFFDDPLFVKAPEGMVPTRKAEALRPAVVDVVAAIRQRILSEAVFDAASSRRLFTF